MGLTVAGIPAATTHAAAAAAAAAGAIARDVARLRNKGREGISGSASRSFRGS
jgi:hypothetical protein